MNILTTQSNYLYKNSNIHLSHYNILYNCKIYLTSFKRTVKNRSKILLLILLCGQFTRIYHQTRHFKVTSYLRDTCNIDFPINNKTGKFKSFGFIRDLGHVSDELIKFDGMAYYDNELKTEDAASTGKRTNNNTSNEPQRHSVVVKNHPANQNLKISSDSKKSLQKKSK